MEHKINIKFGEINNLADARYAAGAGAAFIGFNQSPQHPQYISPNDLKEICGWAAGPAIVTEWENEIPEIIADTCNRLDIEYIQLNNYNPQVTKALKTDFSVIQNITLHANDTIGDVIKRMNDVNGLVMYNMYSFDSLEDQELFLSKSSHKLLLLDCCRDYPVLLNFHFNVNNLLPIIEEFQPFGINLKGSNEIKPGYNDFDELNDIVSLLEKV